MMIYPTRGDPKLVVLDTTTSSGMNGMRLQASGRTGMAPTPPSPHITQTGSRLLPSWYPPHNCTLPTYTQTSLHLPLPPKLGPTSPRSPDRPCSSVCSLDFPGPAKSWAGSPGWVPTGQWHSGTLLSARWIWWHPDATRHQTSFSRDTDIEQHLLTDSKARAHSIYMVSHKVTLKRDGKPIALSLNSMFNP